MLLHNLTLFLWRHSNTIEDTKKTVVSIPNSPENLYFSKHIWSALYVCGQCCFKQVNVFPSLNSKYWLLKNISWSLENFMNAKYCSAKPFADSFLWCHLNISLFITQSHFKAPHFLIKFHDKAGNRKYWWMFLPDFANREKLFFKSSKHPHQSE